MNLNTLLFGVYPYICLAVFLIGSWLRYDREPYTWRSESSQMLRRGRYFHVASNFFHIGILGIFFGHLVGLLTPASVFHAIGLDAGAKQWLAIMAGGEEAAFERAKPALSAMGRPTLVGPAGTGQLAKLANQGIVATTIGIVAEAMLLMQ